MGTVHRAFDPASGREVALKVFEGGSVLRFEREGILSARLDHPRIVRIHASGVRGGRPCLVYELIEGGRTLGDMLREGCEQQHALEVLLDGARGLGHAHVHGIVHRDVKPDNVLVERGGRAKMTDFGLARLEGLDQLTATGAVLGTPLYMAPEALTGKQALVGPETDVWGLGAILYEILSGLPPYSADTLMTLTIQVVGSATPPIDAERQAPEALVAIASRALAKAPAERYSTADDFADDLERYLAGGESESRSKARWGLGLAAGVALLALVLGLIFASRPSSLAQDRADPPQPSLSPTPGPRRHSQSWSEIEAISDPVESYLATRRWLGANPKHERASRARRALKRAHERPLRSISLGARPDDRIVVAFAPEGQILAAAQRGGFVTCWSGRRKLWTFKGAERCGALSTPKGALWWSSPPARFYGWGPAGADGPPLLELGDRDVRYVALSPKGDRIALVTVGPQTLLIARWPGGPLEHSIQLPEPAHVVMFGPNGDYVAVGFGSPNRATFTPRGSELRLVYSATGKVAQRKEFETGIPISLAVEPGQTRVLVGLSSGNLVGLNPKTGVETIFRPFVEEKISVGGFRDGVRILEFDSSGQTLWIATNGAKGLGRLIEVDWTSRSVRSTRALKTATETLALSADDTLLLRGTRSGTWQLWATHH
ncbi:MAG: serine/threonine protein kinase [Planctomycetes bacterium]|nr:serine/threonine protein kinase [Planctomycetota bacterium]